MTCDAPAGATPGGVMRIDGADLPKKSGPDADRRERRRLVAERSAAIRKQEREARRRQASSSLRILREQIAATRQAERARGSFGDLLDRGTAWECTDQVRRLVDVLDDRAPRLLKLENREILIRVVALPWHRPVEAWRPVACSSRARLNSLIDHLLVRYPVPLFLRHAFLATSDDDCLQVSVVDLFRHQADGRSAREAVATGLIPLPLTRRMLHLFVNSPAGFTVTDALQRAQVLGYGGSEPLARAVVGARIQDKMHATHEFWAQAVHWFCRQPDLAPAQVGPLVDYFEHRCREDKRFSTKGRTVGSLTRDMLSWHKELHVGRRLRLVRFRPSGLANGTWIHKANGKPETWTMREILSGRELAIEGRAMNHCVATYAGTIGLGRCSIWSLCRDGERALTIEADKAGMQVKQARGPCNRKPSPAEARWLRAWAAENGLKVGDYVLGLAD